MVLPAVILPGYLAGAIEYQALEQTLKELGITAVTVPIRRRTWVPTIGGRSMVPVLQLLDQTIQQTLQDFGVSQVNLIGHSAGGWISRIYLGEKPYLIHGDVTAEIGLWNARKSVATLVTLGTPHTSLERWTKRNLDFVNVNYPGAFYTNVRYICVAGKAVYGKFGQWLAYNSYKLTCGQANTWGDGITPIQAAHLQGAENLTLEGVYHAPRPGKIWYGSPEPTRIWAAYLA